MNKILVSVFPDDTSAYEGINALKDLHNQGDITLYASTVIAKNADGTFSTRDAADRGPLGMLVGMVGGGLIGLLGGPVGAIAGAYVGSFGGLIYDMFQYGMDVDFVNEVGSSLEPGTVAIIADVDEAWITPIETRLAPLGARTFRRVPGDWVDEQLNREAEIASAELAQLNAELRDSAAEARATIQKRIDEQTKKLKDLSVRIDRRVDESEKEFQARLATLEAQLKDPVVRRKADVEARIAELKADYQVRRQKLEHARELSREAHQLRVEALTR